MHISGTLTGELQCKTKSKEHLRCNSNSIPGNQPKRSIGETFKCASILPALSKSKGDTSGILPEKMTNEDVDNSNNPPPLSKSSDMISDSRGSR